MKTETQIEPIGNYRDRLTEGTRFNYRGVYSNGKPYPTAVFDLNSDRWHVERVVERGIVISHPSNNGHQHLKEWTDLIAGIKFA